MNLDISHPLLVGVDESNHGRYPEIYVATFSQIEKDIQPFRRGKIRKNHQSLWGWLSNRDYSFLMLSRSEIERLKQREIPGIIVTSLLMPQFYRFEGDIKIYIDGEVPLTRKEYTRDLVSEICELSRAHIHIDNGPNYDQLIPLVNHADELAHYCFRHRTPHQLSRNKHIRNLL